MNRHLNRLCVGVVLATGLATVTTAAMSQAMVKDGILTNHNGMTLYTFDKDAAGTGKSVCNGQCATNWPPLMASSSDSASGGSSASKDYSIITRDDGTKQWAYKGKPLYLWIKDQKPGDKTGDGVNNIWHIAKP